MPKGGELVILVHQSLTQDEIMIKLHSIYTISIVLKHYLGGEEKESGKGQGRI